MLISNNDFVCHACWTAAWNEIRHPAESVSPSAARLICVGCGRSLRRQRSHLLSQDTPRESQIRENISRQIAPRQVKFQINNAFISVCVLKKGTHFKLAYSCI